ncbi:AAA family ATPase [Kribbella sp. NPDC050820]|uniref:ATP-binding protein n=1 Tax=Kribbella sp. NPDC050820 TaxID=3155408 RepID=UPI0034097F7A
MEAWGGLVGRAVELEQLSRFVAGVGEHGGALLLSGDAGVGKSALVEAAVGQALADDVRILRAAGVQFEADITYASLHQLLQTCLDEFDSLSPRNAGTLKVALGLADGPPPAPLMVAGAVLALLQRLAKERPVLMVVDDVPWLDRASGLVLGMVARRLVGTRSALLGAARTGESSFFDHSDLAIEHIQPLPDEAAAELLSTRYPALAPRVRRRLLADAQGNPLALLELPVALGDHLDGVAGSVPAVLPLGRRLQSAFTSRIKGLPDSTYGVLLLAALEGTGDLRLIRRIAASRNRDALAPAERANVIRVDNSTERLVFRHPLMRSAIVDLSTSSQRREAHAVLAQHLADQPERRVWHLAEATTEPDEEVAALLQGVAHANLRRGDSVGAVTQLLRAAELSPTGSARSGRLAEAAYLGSIVTGDLRDAPRLLDAARQSHEGAGGPLSLAVAGAYQLLHSDGDIDTAHRLLVDAVNDLDDPGDAHNKVLIEALYTLLMICFFGGRPALWPPYDAAIARLKPRVPELLGILSRTFSDPARASQQALAQLDASIAGLTDQVSPARIIRTGIAAAYLDRLADCRDALYRAVQHGREGGAITSAIEALFLLGQDSFHTGQWDQAQHLVHEGLQLCDKHGYKLLSWPGLLITGLLAAARGDTATPATIAQQMNAWAGPRRARTMQLYAAHIQTLAALGRSDFEAAFTQASLISPAGTIAPYCPHALWVFLDLVEAAMLTGRHAEAVAHVKAAQAISLETLSDRLRLVVLTTAAITETDVDDDRLEEAIASPTNDRWPFDLARIQLTYGAYLRRTKNTSRARHHLTAASATFQRLNARPWTTRTENELRATGIPHDSPGDAKLTTQQRQIAELAAAGLTNKQIAERLVLSPRTVSTHLYQIFPKLGITTRAALRDALDRLPHPHE